MKKIIIGLVLFGTIVGCLSSCYSGPRFGCTKSRYITGHKPDGYGY